MIRSRDFAAVSLVTMAIFFTRTASRQTLVPLLSVERLSFTYGDRPVELRRGLYHTASYHYRNELN